MVDPVLLQVTAAVWATLAFVLVSFWGIAGWALVRTLRQEDRKIELLERQDRIDSYSPKALADLRTFVENNPEDPYTADARRRYNECVETLRETDRQFYDWSEEEIDRLERL